eukprot:3755985-Alexandrium_andersonii.AAC.2
MTGGALDAAENGGEGRRTQFTRGVLDDGWPAPGVHAPAGPGERRACEAQASNLIPEAPEGRVLCRCFPLLRNLATRGAVWDFAGGSLTGFGGVS